MRPAVQRPDPGEHVSGEATCDDCRAAFVLDTRKLALSDPPPRFWEKFVREGLAGYRRVYCPECTAAREERLDAEEEGRKEESVLARRLRLSGIPEPLRRPITDVNGKSGAIIEAAWEWAEGKRRGVLLTGPVGVGKTFLAGVAATGRASFSAVRWLSVPALLAGLRAGYGTREQREAASALALNYGQRPALVLDDLDKSRPAEIAMEPLFLAIDRWTVEELPLMVTMNRGLDRLGDNWPEAFSGPIASRLNGYCATLEVGGPDRRAG